MGSYQTILVGVDFTPLCDLAVTAAGELGQTLGARRIHLVHVASAVPPWAGSPVGVSTEMFELAWDAAHQISNRQLEALPKPKVSAEITHETRIGAPVSELVDAAKSVGADLIVIASHRRGRVSRFVLGSVASALLRAAPCPVLVVGDDRGRVKAFHEVIAAVDLSPVSSQVLRHAIELTRPVEGHVRVISLAEVHALMARVPEQALASVDRGDVAAQYEAQYRAELDKLVDEARAALRGPEAARVSIEVDVRTSGNPREVILDATRRFDPDGVVIGTSGHNAWQRMVLGSTATYVVAEAPCPVLVIPAG